MEIYDRPGARVRPKVRMLKAKVIKTLLYGCVTRRPNKLDYDRLRQAHHSVHLQCPGSWKRKRDDHILSYTNYPAKTDSENIESTTRARRMMFAGVVTSVGAGSLPQRLMLGELVGGKGYPGGQEKNWMVSLKEDMTEFGMKFERWKNAPQKFGRWFRRVGDGTEADTGRPSPRHQPLTPILGGRQWGE